MILGYVFSSDWGAKKNQTKKDISELKLEYYVNLKDIIKCYWIICIFLFYIILLIL